MYQSPILLSQDKATALRRPAGARIVLIMLWAIPVIKTQFLASGDMTYGHNPEGSIRFLHGTVWLTGMVDIAGYIVHGVAVDRIAVIQMKDVDIACFATVHALGGGNLF